jgi:hypothetical protein
MVSLMRPCPPGGDTAVGVGRGAGAVGIDVLDFQEGIADILDDEGMRQFPVFKNFTEIKGGLGNLGLRPDGGPGRQWRAKQQ